MIVDAEPWKDVMPRKCKVVGQDAPAPLSTGTGALLVLVGLAVVIFELDKRVPR
jgi:hypothetical protein